MPRFSLLVLALIRVLFTGSVCDAIAAQTTEAPTPARIDPWGIRGTCVLGGGGKLPKVIYEQFLLLAGGKQARVLIVPTASARADTAEGRTATLQRWQAAHPGYHFEILHTRDRTEANSDAFAKKIQNATAVWFGGGAQSRLSEAYVGTRVERELHALLQRGGIIGGSSAGTAIQTRVMIAGGKAPPRLKTGVNLLPFAIADQHFTQRKRLPRLLLALNMSPGHFGIGIDESTAIIVQQRSVRVLGKGKAHFVLPKTATQPQRIVSLGKGHRTDLPTWQRAARNRTFGAWPPSKPPQPTVKSGSLILVGGHHTPDAAFERFVTLAGGPANARIVIVPTATPSLARHSDLLQLKLKKLGISNLQLLEAEHPDDVTARHTQMLDQATGVWFDGGRTWRILDTFEGTTVPPALHRLLKRGGAIAGMANLHSDFQLRGDPLTPKHLHCEGYDRGLGFLPGSAIDDQFTPHSSLTDLTALITKHPQLLGINLIDHTAALITASTLEVLGTQPITLIHQSPPTTTTLQPGTHWHLLQAKRTR